jgi:hypothetical protein
MAASHSPDILPRLSPTGMEPVTAVPEIRIRSCNEREVRVDAYVARYAPESRTCERS